MSKNYTGGLNFSWPIKGDTNWDTTADAALTTVSNHSHTGAGDGNTLLTASYTADSVTGAKIKLANNEPLRARNQASSADINILKLNTSNQLEVGAPEVFADTVQTVSAVSTITVTSNNIVASGTTYAVTLNAGATGQAFFFYNGASGTVTIGGVAVGTGKSAYFRYLSATWVAVLSA